MIRVGIGIDFHRFAPNRKLILGGVEIRYKLGLAGHSDADVLTHAICDALLGAAGLGDIGGHFPDNDPRYKNIASLELLLQVGRMLREGNYKIVNIDATVIAQEPRLGPFIPKMGENLAAVLDLAPERVSIKATTPESMGPIGRKEGIAAYAVCLIAISSEQEGNSPATDEPDDVVISD